MIIPSKSDRRKSGIYKITSKTNGRVYIGQSVDLWTRINEGYYQKLPKNKGHNIHMQRAWNKYGAEDFIFEILEYVSHDDLDERETYWIQFYESHINKKGYNMTTEGNSNKGYVMSEDRKRRQSLAMTGEGNGMYGKTHTEEVRRAISESRSIPIVQLSLDGEFIREWKSTKDAAEYYNIARTPITRVLVKKTYTSCGFIWVYQEEYAQGLFDIDEHKTKMKRHLTPVVRLSFDGRVLGVYESVSEAQNTTGAKNVVTVCQGKKRVAKDSTWMYLDDYEKYGFNHEKFSDLAIRYGKIVQLDLKGSVIKTWESIKEIESSGNFNHHTVSACCRGKAKTHKDSVWMYEKDFLEKGFNPNQIKKEINAPHSRLVIQLSETHEYINQFPSIAEASRQTGVASNGIRRVALGEKSHVTAGGFKWKFA